MPLMTFMTNITKTLKVVSDLKLIIKQSTARRKVSNKSRSPGLQEFFIFFKKVQLDIANANKHSGNYKLRCTKCTILLQSLD